MIFLLQIAIMKEFVKAIFTMQNGVEVYKRVFSDLDTPVLYNLNFGHSYPRCLIPYDAEVTVDYDNKRVFINSKFLKDEQKIKTK